MATVETLLQNVDLIAERRRSEPGELHPFRKVHMHCKECGKPIIIAQKNVRPEGHWCREHHSLKPGWKEKVTKAAKNRSPEWKQVKTEQNKELAKDPNWRAAVTNGSRERSKDPMWRKKMSAGLQGISVEEWQCFTHFLPYCEKFNEIFKEGVRMHHGYKCALCGHIWQQGERKLTVHHVHNRKDSCCAADAPIAFVCLCTTGCHQRITKRWREYVDYFMDYIQENFNGKSYLTKEELDILRKY